MKAKIDYNQDNEPRLILELETEEEREIFKAESDMDLISQKLNKDTGNLSLMYALAPI